MRTLTLGLEWFLNPDHVPLLVGQEKGWFADAGLEIDLVVPEEHLDAVDEIEAGRMDLAVTEPLHLVEDRAGGEDVVGFARFLHTNGGVMYFAESGIERPRDMAGMRIQYPGAPGPGGPAIVGTMVEADGGEANPEAFGRVNNSFYHTDALAEGLADVATLVFYNFEVVEARHRGHDARFFALKDWGVPDFCQLVLITTPEVLESRRDDLRAFLRVLQRGLDFIHQHPDAARDIYFRRAEEDPSDPMTREIFQATVPCFTYDLSMASDYYRRLAGWMEGRGLIETSPESADLWTNELVI
jgi:ABC-type nitrate/sulfonate/bicarbonate transport system substrate-binding protein